MATAIQVKWLHSDGFRRFELEQPTFGTLMEAIKGRIPTFQGGICYTDAEGDKILITSDLDFGDMLKYFQKGAGDGQEIVVKIQTNDVLVGEQPQTRESPAVTSSTTQQISRQKQRQQNQKVEVIELLESADERSNSPRAGTEQMAGALAEMFAGNRPLAARVGAPSSSQLFHHHNPKIPKEADNLMKALFQEMDKIDEKTIIHQHPEKVAEQQSPSNEMQPGHSSWYEVPSEFSTNNLMWNNPPNGMRTATANVIPGAGVEVAGGDEPDNNSLLNATFDLDHRMWQKRKQVSNLVNCTLCGAAVTNEGSSLKLHTNLHHLKLPIFACKYCWKVDHKFSRANMIRHMQREHPEKQELDFDHNSGKYRTELYTKIEECFPAAERKKLMNQ